MERAIIGRVRGLFDSRGISQRELAESLGVSPSWVSAFFSGKRPANDIHILIKLARYFGVSVGYLLNETERGRDAGASTLLAAWESMADERDRKAILSLALTLKRDSGGLDTEPPPEPSHAPDAGGGTTKGRAKRR